MSRRCPLPIDEFSKKDGPPVAKLRNEIAELVPRIGCGQRFRAFGKLVAGKDACAFICRKGFRVEAQLFGKRAVEQQKPRLFDDGRMGPAMEAGAQPGIAVIEREMSGHEFRTAFLASPIGIGGLDTADGVSIPNFEGKAVRLPFAACGVL